MRPHAEQRHVVLQLRALVAMAGEALSPSRMSAASAAALYPSGLDRHPSLLAARCPRLWLLLAVCERSTFLGKLFETIITISALSPSSSENTPLANSIRTIRG